MGTEPLLAAFVYALSIPINEIPFWDAERLMNESKPISVVGREALSDVEIGGLVFKKGQGVQITTDLIKSTSPPQKSPLEGIPFGVGVHICPGKKLSLIIADSFIRNWINAQQIHQKISKVVLFRDFALRARDIT